MDTGNVRNYNYTMGTYLSWGDSVPYEGPGNQHYYHHLSVNPGTWIKVQFDEFPQHKRGSFVTGNDPSYMEAGKHYLENMIFFYMAACDWNEGGPLTSFKIDEMRFYSTKDTAEPDQNNESVTSFNVGYWPGEDYWEISWNDMSWTDGGTHRNKPKYATFDVRWSTKPISNANFESANRIDPLFNGGQDVAGEDHLVRHYEGKPVTWTRFRLPDDIEQNYNRIYFAVKDVSEKGRHKGSVFPWNTVKSGDGHDAPSPYIRTIDYDLRPDLQAQSALLLAMKENVILSRAYECED